MSKLRKYYSDKIYCIEYNQRAKLDYNTDSRFVECPVCKSSVVFKDYGKSKSDYSSHFWYLHKMYSDEYKEYVYHGFKLDYYCSEYKDRNGRIIKTSRRDLAAEDTFYLVALNHELVYKLAMKIASNFDVIFKGDIRKHQITRLECLKKMANLKLVKRRDLIKEANERKRKFEKDNNLTSKKFGFDPYNTTIGELL